MMPLAARAAIAAAAHDADAKAVSAGTAATSHRITNIANRHAHMIAAPRAYQAFRVSEESTKGAHTNSNVKARLVAATIVATCLTETPALTRLLARARLTTPIGQTVAACKKKNVNGGAFFVTVGMCRPPIAPTSR